jgi:hypothetical protein
MAALSGIENARLLTRILNTVRLYTLEGHVERYAKLGCNKISPSGIPEQ